MLTQWFAMIKVPRRANTAGFRINAEHLLDRTIGVGGHGVLDLGHFLLVLLPGKMRKRPSGK